MNLRKLMMVGAFAAALTASFAFKAERKHQTTFASAWDPIDTYACDSLLPTDDDCYRFNTGPQCTAYYSNDYPSLPAYDEPDGGLYCYYPLYHSAN